MTKKAKVYRTSLGIWIHRCPKCPSLYIVAHDSHAEAMQDAHKHMLSAHAPAREVTRLRQNRPNNWRKR